MQRGLIALTMLWLAAGGAVSAQSTPYPMVQRAAEAVGQARILGVVLNRAELAGLPTSYGYYGANAYRPKKARRWFGRRATAEPASR